MYRRIVSLLLLPSLLLSQAAVRGHPHDDGTPAGHDTHPHVHTHLSPADPSHSQHHPHYDHGHHHHGHGGHRHHHEVEAPASDLPPAPTTEPASDHDSDAVYIAAEAAAVERMMPSVELMGFVFFLRDSPAIWGILASTPPVAFRSHPPPSPDPACPRYLRHLALLM
jgi:hypothetical protein